MSMSKELKREWLPKLQVRYARRNREGKSRMLDELCEDYQYERKYAIKLLSGGLPVCARRVHPGLLAGDAGLSARLSRLTAIWAYLFVAIVKRQLKIRKSLNEILKIVSV